MAAFRESFGTAVNYYVRRNEVLATSEGKLTSQFVYLVDVAAARDLTTVSFFASDPSLWSQLTDDPAEVERLQTQKIQVVADYSARPPRAYLTYTGTDGWDGTWLDVDTSAGVPFGLDQRAGSTAGHTIGLLDLLDLQPVGFELEADGELEYEVPAAIAAEFLPDNLALALLDAGVDARTLDGTSPASAHPAFGGGVEVSVGLSSFLRAAAAQVDDVDLADYLYYIGLAVNVNVSEIGTTDRVDLPAPESIVREPPSNA